MSNYVIIGNGVAGVTAAQGIARAESSASVHIYGAEPYPYYQRPRLWEFLAGEIDQEELYFRSLDWYAEKGIQVHLNARAVSLDPPKHRLTLASGETVDYDRLLLATGARCFVPPFDGTDKAGVFTLRSLNDALAIKAYAQDISSAVVIGGGLLGLETARALVVAGLEVTVIEFAPHLLPRQLDAEGAQILRDHLESIGIRLILTNAQTEKVLGQERASGVQLKNDRQVPGELVLISTGIRSRIELPRQSGLEVKRGVIVDPYLRTSATDVYAAGDVAEFDGVVYGIIPAAIEQARAAAVNMVDAQSSRYTGTIPATTLKVVGIDLTSLGEATVSGDEYDVVRQADPQAQVYKRLTLRDGAVVGAILMGNRQNVLPVKQLIASGRDVSAYRDRLLEDDFDLKALAKGQLPPNTE